jgi:hypothetical protein
MLTVFGNAALGVELPDALKRCATEKDDQRRLACYDTEVARLGAEPAARLPGPSASLPAPAAAAGAPSAAANADANPAPDPVGDAEDNFGRRGDLRKPEPIEASEVSGSVAGFARGPDGKFVVTLDSGQVWREISPNASIRLKTGDKVRIERGSLGSYLLVAPNKRSSKVTRIK